MCGPLGPASKGASMSASAAAARNAVALSAAAVAVLCLTLPVSTQNLRRERRHTWIEGREAAEGEVLVKYRGHRSPSTHAQ